MKMNNTVQKRVILEVLNAVVTHPTAEELYLAVKGRLPSISRGTVYRNLDKMASTGQILCLEMAGKQRHYDGRVEPHLHMRCTCCGAVRDLMLAKSELIVKYLERTVHDNALEGVNLEFAGKCERCSDDEPLHYTIVKPQ